MPWQPPPPRPGGRTHPPGGVFEKNISGTDVWFDCMYHVYLYITPVDTYADQLAIHIHTLYADVEI